jgi:hypothetical protein
MVVPTTEANGWQRVLIVLPEAKSEVQRVSIFGLILTGSASTDDAVKPLNILGFEGAFVWGFAPPPLPLSSTQSPTYLLTTYLPTSSR